MIVVAVRSQDKSRARAKAGMCKIGHYVSYLSPLLAKDETHLAESEYTVRRNTLNLKRLDQPTRNMVALMSFVVPVAICAFAIASTSAAQTASAVSASAPQAVPKDNSSTLRFTPSKKILSNLKAGVPSAVNLCNGQTIGGILTDSDGLKADTGSSPCGESQNPTPNTVTGGNPPYHFQFDTGSFPPLGMHLGMNGLLYGTPAKPPLGGYKPFRVCAVDMSGTPDCHEMALGATAAPHSSHVPIILGAAALGGVAAVVGAKEMSNSSASSSGGSEAGTCDGMSSTNACGACSCTDYGTCNNPSSQCGGSVCWWQPGADNAGTAPFCAGGKPD